MNLGISQLAFKDFNELKNNITLLKDNNINNIEIVHSKIDEDFNNYKNLFIENNLHTKSTQSILFNSGVNDFLEESFITHIKKIIEKNSFFGVETLVLGSPKQRMNFNENKLLTQFKILDSILNSYNQILCIEPNSKVYQGKYFFTVREIIKFINNGEFNNIKTMIDTHNLIYEGESPFEIYNENKKIIYHIHISENNLLDFVESNEHINLSKSLRSDEFKGKIIYEVLPTQNLKYSLENFKNIYY